jgi:hypothetical protein
MSEKFPARAVNAIKVPAGNSDDEMVEEEDQRGRMQIVYYHFPKKGRSDKFTQVGRRLDTNRQEEEDYIKRRRFTLKERSRKVMSPHYKKLRYQLMQIYHSLIQLIKRVASRTCPKALLSTGSTRSSSTRAQ